MLEELRQSLDSRGVSLSWDESLLDHLVKKSYSVTYGARNLRRTIQKDIEDPVAEKLIDSVMTPVYTISLSADENGVVVKAE